MCVYIDIIPIPYIDVDVNIEINKKAKKKMKDGTVLCSSCTMPGYILKESNSECHEET